MKGHIGSLILGAIAIAALFTGNVALATMCAIVIFLIEDNL